MRNLSGKSVLERVDFLAHGANIADNASRPIERALAFGA